MHSTRHSLLPSVWLTCLAAIWCSLLISGLLCGAMDGTIAQELSTVARMASSMTLVVASWTWFVRAAESGPKKFSAQIALGMTLGFAGDLFMANLLPVSEPTLAGIGAFGLGHLAYLRAMFLVGELGGPGARLKRYLAWIGWMVVGLIGWGIIVYPSAAPATLRWAALPYTLLLASAAGFASGLAIVARVFVAMAVGTALFFISDLILAGQLFERFQLRIFVSPVWLTYGPGQMLIVYGGNFAMQGCSGTSLAPTNHNVSAHSNSG